MAVGTKKNVEIRICVDPQPLNKTLIRERYLLPTLDGMLPKLNRAKVFSKVGLFKEYWHVTLDEESSKLTTMAIPFGQFRFKILPFGLKVCSSTKKSQNLCQKTSRV